MQLNRFTDLGLRALIMLSHIPSSSGKLLTVEKIAQTLSISRNHLVKIVHFMASKGWIESYKGRHGGLRLAQATYTRPLGELVRQLEAHSSENRPLIDCLQPYCALLPYCTLPPILNKALEAFYAVFDQYTLLDISRHDRKSHEILLHWLSPQAQATSDQP